MLQPQQVSACSYHGSQFAQDMLVQGTWSARCSTEAHSRIWPAQVSAQQRQVASRRQWLTVVCPLLLQRPPQGYNITVFHSMHAEVENYQVHHWTVSTQLQHGALQPYSSFSHAINCRNAEQTSQVVLLEVVMSRQQPSVTMIKRRAQCLVCLEPSPHAVFVASDCCCILSPVPVNPRLPCGPGC